MNEHWTPEMMRRYLTGTLDSPQEWLALENHLDACAECRKALRSAVAVVSLTQKLLPAPGAGKDDCPDQGMLSRTVLGRASVVEREIVETHAGDCTRCAEILRSLEAPDIEPPVLWWQELLRSLATMGRSRRYRFATAAAIVGVSLVATASWSRGGSVINQRQALVEQVVRQIGEVLAEARPTLKAVRNLFKQDARRYATSGSGPLREENWHARTELLTQLLQTAPQFDRLYYGDASGDFTFAGRSDAERANPGGGLHVEHRFVVEDRRRGTRAFKWHEYPVIERAGEEVIDWNHRTDTGRESDNYDNRDRPWYQAAKRTRAFAWTVHRNIGSDSYGATGSLPLIEGGKVVGVFGIGLELSDLSNALSNYVKRLEVLSHATRVFVLSNEGSRSRILLRGKGSRFIAPEKDAPPLVRESKDPILQEIVARLEQPGSSRVPDTQDSVREFNITGYYVAAQRSGVENLPWTVIVAVPRQDIQRGAFPTYGLAAIGAGVMVLLLAAAAWAGKRPI